MLMLFVVTLSVLTYVNVRMVLQGMVSTAMVRFLEESNLEFSLSFPLTRCKFFTIFTKSFTTTE